jgi:hypothetical protein
MKKLLTLAIFIFILANVSAQNADQKWGISIFGGKTEYVGDFGNGFFDWDPWVYGHIGVSGNRYLNSSFDLNLQLETGSYGYWESSTSNFYAKKTDGALLLRYKFNNGYAIKEDALVAPFLTAGFGFASFAAEEDELRTKTDDWDAFVTLGGGFRFQVDPRFSFEYQFLYNFTNGDERDLNTTDEMNDRFLSHSLGIIFNL